MGKETHLNGMHRTREQTTQYLPSTVRQKHADKPSTRGTTAANCTYKNKHMTESLTTVAQKTHTNLSCGVVRNIPNSEGCSRRFLIRIEHIHGSLLQQNESQFPSGLVVGRCCARLAAVGCRFAI